MAMIGVQVTSQEVPPSVVNPNNTANAFMAGFADWGPVGSVGVTTSQNSLGAVAALIGGPNGGIIQNSRSATNATLYDSVDAFFREGGANVFISRVLGNSPTKGTLNITDAASATCATLTAQYYGVGSSNLNAVVTNTSGASYTVVLQDGQSNVLATSPTLSASAKGDLVTWAATTNLCTAACVTACVPRTLGSVAFSAGTDDRTTAAASANWANAINGGFGFGLGPGQVMAPAITNTASPGIWGILGNHAITNNRVALLDGTDGNSASQAVAEVSAASLGASLGGYCGIWAGNLQIPGVTAGTTRVIAPSPVVAALCARADNQGNPNLAAAGLGFPLQYVSGINTVYSGPLTGDIAKLNDAGINVFSTQYGVLQNYGFVSALATPAGDAIYWQLSHSRLRMALLYSSALAAQPYTFGQLDGQGQTTAQFGGALQGMLLGFYQAGALFGANASDAFTVNTGAQVNTPASLQAGNLVAIIAVRMSPFAQLVQITINAVPITQTLVQTTGTSSSTT